MSYRRPRFVREESWRYKRVKQPWRAPHGKTSRVRRSKKGWPAVVKIGYSRPRATRGLHPSGLREVPVWRPKDLEKLDPKIHAARIAHTVGENKRVQILEEAKKANIRVLNPGLKKAPVTPEIAPEPTAAEPAQGTTTEKAEEKETKPIEAKPRKKSKPKTTKGRKSKK